MTGETVLTPTAVSERHHNVIAGSKAYDAITHLLNDTGTFVAQNDGIGRDAQVARHGIGVADARRYDPYQYFAGSRTRQGDFLKCKVFTLSVSHSSLNFHKVYLLSGELGP